MLAAEKFELELRLTFLIHDTSRLRGVAFDRYLKPLKVTRSQCWVLGQLSRQDGVTQSHLASNLALGKVALGNLIDRLEKNGLVRRVPNPDDRRVNLIYLAAKSKGLLLRIRKANHEFNAHLLAGLADEELVTTTKTLEVMKRHVRQYLSSSQGDRGKGLKRGARAGGLGRQGVPAASDA